MADSNTDISKMKVIDLRKELKSRGLPITGDKAELVARLQAALSQDTDEHADINLDSDEIDSDGVLDEDEKTQNDLLDDSVVESLSDDLALAEPAPAPAPAAKPAEAKPHKPLKRKITMSEKEPAATEKGDENKETVAKKIVLNRPNSTTTVTTTTPEQKTEEKPKTETTTDTESNKIKITADLDTKTRLELRAKRFGLPVKMSDAERKQARKERFGGSAASKPGALSTTNTDVASAEKLKQRAERFGQSVSKFMTDIEKQEKLEKRKAKFGTVK